MLGLESAKGQDTPGSKATGASVAEENKPLSDAEGRQVASAIGSVLYLALGRPEIQYAAKCLAADLRQPTELTRVRAKRLGRFVLEHPSAEWHDVV